MTPNAYLFFGGRCQEAFTFYAQLLGGKIEAMLNTDDAPAEAQIAPDWRGKIMHARMRIGDAVLMGSDAPSAHYQRPAGFAVHLPVAGAAEAQRIFDALADRGEIRMPLAQTFFSFRFGMVVDRFGTPWMVDCEKSPDAASA